MVTAFVAAVAALAVLLPAVAGFGRSRTYAWIGFTGTILGGVVLVLTSTPPGFDANAAPHHWLFPASFGQELAAALIAGGVAGLIGAFAAGRNEPIEHTELSHL